MDNLVSIDDFDWSNFSPSPSPDVGGGQLDATSPEGAAPPEQAAPSPYPYDPSKLPRGAREYKGDKYKNRRPGNATLSFDDMDWAGDTSGYVPPPQPSKHWPGITGIVAGYQGASSAMQGVVDMAKIDAMPEDQQLAALLEYGKRPFDPNDTQMPVPGVENIHGVGDALTWAADSAGT
jgi:hypothetical protein